MAAERVLFMASLFEECTSLMYSHLLGEDEMKGAVYFRSANPECDIEQIARDERERR